MTDDKPAGGLGVLVVDDDADMRTLVSRMLKRMRIGRILEVDSAQQALERLAAATISGRSASAASIVPTTAMPSATAAAVSATRAGRTSTPTSTVSGACSGSRASTARPIAS
jgi:CheY-like chemotaxis protein